jgi:hypothetical protein
MTDSDDSKKVAPRPYRVPPAEFRFIGARHAFTENCTGARASII